MSKRKQKPKQPDLGAVIHAQNELAMAFRSMEGAISSLWLWVIIAFCLAAVGYIVAVMG